MTRAAAALLLLCALGVARAQEAATPAPPRLESEWKLDVPAGSEEEVWAWLVRRYSAGPGSILPELGQGFSASTSDEDFLDDYFDDTKFSLLRLEAGLRHRGRWFREDTANRKHGRELLQLKGAGSQVRTEQKWDVRPLADEWRNDPEENVPGMQLLARGERDELRAALKAMGVDADDLIHALQIQQRRRRVYVAQGGSAFATITLDEARPRKLWWRTSFAEIELELNEIRYTAASPAEREVMEQKNARIAGDLMQAFPGIRRDQTPKYNKAFARLEQGAWLFRPSLVIGLPLPLLLLLPPLVAGLLVAAARRQARLVVRWR